MYYLIYRDLFRDSLNKILKEGGRRRDISMGYLFGKLGAVIEIGWINQIIGGISKV